MKEEDYTHRLGLLEDRHKNLHSVIEALEAEKAPDKYIKKFKVDKLKLKDEISIIQERISLQKS